MHTPPDPGEQALAGDTAPPSHLPNAARTPLPSGLPDVGATSLPAAALLPRLLCALYEGLLLAGTLMVAGFVLVPLGRAFGLGPDETRSYTRAWAMTVVSAYFLWFWLHGGQTLPMKTWRIRICRRDGRPLTAEQAMLRMVLAWAGWGLLGAHFLWAVFDSDRQFLHDRIMNTRIVRLD